MKEAVFLLSLLSNSCVAGSPYFNMSDVLKSAFPPASFKCVTSRINLSSGVSFRTDTNRAVHHRRQGIQRRMVLVVNFFDFF